MRRFLVVLVLGSAFGAVFLATPALASEPMSDFNVKFESLAVNAKGEALVTYRRTDGKVRRVLVWGGLNANAPTDPSIRQVRFKYDYAGGWGKYRKASYWSTFRNVCSAYDGPALVYLVAACKAPDGTYCHSFVPQKPFPGYPSKEMRPPAPGERYRVTVMGPGVTPVIQWEGLGLTAADRAFAASVTTVFDEIMAGDRICAPER